MHKRHDTYGQGAIGMEQDNTQVDLNADGAERATGETAAKPASPFKKSSKNRPYWMRTDGNGASGANDPMIIPPGLVDAGRAKDAEPIPSDIAGMSMADAPFPRTRYESMDGSLSGQRPLAGPTDEVHDPVAPEPLEPSAPFEPRRMSERVEPPQGPSMALAPLNYDYGTVGQSVTRKEMVSRKSYVTQQYLKAAAMANSQGERPWYKRLTPFSWGLLSVGTAAFIAGMVYAATIVARPTEPARIADGFAPPEGAAAVVAQIPAEPTAMVVVEPVVVPSATATPAPSATPAPTAEPTAEPTLEVQPTVEPTAEPAPTEAPTADVAAAPAPVATADVVPWAGTMLQPTDGVFMAPESVIADVQSSVSGYYAALRQHRSPDEATRDLVTNQDVFLAQYFAGDALNAVKNEVNAAAELAVLERGDVNVRILSFSPDGSSAMAMVEQRGFTSRFWEKPNLARWQLRRLPDQDVRVQLDYSISDKRWRVSSILETTAVRRASRNTTGNRAPVTRSRPARPVATVAPTTTDTSTEQPVVVTDPTTTETTDQTPVDIPPSNGAAITP
jgi:hypothetical protein